MKLPLNKQKITAAQPGRRAPMTAKDWAIEAEVAQDAGDLARVIVCYRRALELAPFWAQARLALEEALDEQSAQIQARKRRGNTAPLSETSTAPDPYELRAQKKKSAFSAFGDPEPEIEGNDEWSAESVMGRIRINDKVTAHASSAVNAVPRVVNSAKAALVGPKKRGSLGRPVAATAIALSIFVTFAGLLTAATAGSLIGNLFSSPELPRVSAPALPDELRTILEQANRQLIAGEPAVAVTMLMSAQERFPAHAEVIRPATSQAFRSLGVAENRASNFARAADAFRAAAEHDPRTALNWIDLGRALREHGRSIRGNDAVARARAVLLDAEAAYLQALRLTPDDPAALFGLGQVYDALNDRARAISTYDRLVRIAPESFEGRLAAQTLSELRKR